MPKTKRKINIKIEKYFADENMVPKNITLWFIQCALI